ncbi:SprT family zinc-dependent metalloprotease [Alcanivorax sp.]|jgi:predicted metal-dependent hydrolase|uniref:M48 family metallopeptidase n=1 Tax=Alcanivorax sp. TaxID=1872427 RepID=UPI0032D98DBB
MAKPQTPEYRDANGFIAEVTRTSRRKSADIRVEEGAVSVVVPVETSLERIDELLAAKRRWIKEKIALHQEMSPPSSKRYVSGESFSYLGRNYRLKVEKGPFAPVRLLQGRLVVSVPQGSEQPHMIRNALIRWYKRQAETKLREKVTRWAPQVGVEPSGVAIKTFKSRWGSCTAKGELQFNWQIMMTPNRMVDYVVVHELCHLIRHDHSPAFWAEVEKTLPRYEENREWLKQNGHVVAAL